MSATKCGKHIFHTKKSGVVRTYFIKSINNKFTPKNLLKATEHLCSPTAVAIKQAVRGLQTGMT